MARDCMLKDILVCLDGSPGGQRATETAIRIARDQGARVVGVALVDADPGRKGAASSGGAGVKPRRDEVMREDEHRQAQVLLEQLRARCVDAGVTATVIELRGWPAAKVVQEMPAHDLTVLGRAASFLLEHRPERDAHDRAPRPVMVVPEDDAPPGMDILVAFDGSSAARRALQAFADSGLGEGRQLHVASAHDDGEAAWEMAGRGVDLLRERGLPGVAHSVVSGRPIAEALLDVRRKLGAGLVVTGAYTRSRVAEMFWGGVTRTLLDQTPVPLFLHH
jgi:nucleotide-binding universal stress UspA family protein